MSLSNTLYQGISLSQEHNYLDYKYLQTDIMYPLEEDITKDAFMIDYDLHDALTEDGYITLDALPLAEEVICETLMDDDVLTDTGSEGATGSISGDSDPESVDSIESSLQSIISSGLLETHFELYNSHPMDHVVKYHRHSSDPSAKPLRKKPGRKKGQTSKVLHLWEFIRDLLKNPKYNGTIIMWENERDGVFRVVKSAEVASLWGQKKKNKKQMTYEKMSRSMRYSKQEGYFRELPKHGRYPKKLCFQFGPKSSGWK